jgi:hypothetical protein
MLRPYATPHLWHCYWFPSGPPTQLTYPALHPLHVPPTLAFL